MTTAPTCGRLVARLMTVGLVTLSSAALAQGSVSHGRLTVGFPVSPANPVGGNFDLVWEGTDHAYQLWFWYRLPQHLFEHPLPAPDVQTYDGEFITFEWNDIDGLGLSAELSIFAVDCLQPDITCIQDDLGVIELDFELTNHFGFDRAVELFTYFDLDSGGTSSGDTATMRPVQGGGDAIEIVDGPAPVLAIQQDDPHDHRVAPFPAVRNALTDLSIDNFSNAGLPLLNADFTAGLQRELLLPAAGGSESNFGYILIYPRLFSDDFESGDLSAWSQSR